MTAKDLKNALLQEAVQGKLVPQIASEGNAKDLLEEIRKEKLSHGLDFANAKSGKKKSKKETALAGSNEPAACSARKLYESSLSRLTNPCDIKEEDIPFDIPENWCWCKLGEIAEVSSSKRIYANEQTTTGVPFLRVSDLVAKINGIEKNDLYISEEHYMSFKKNGLVPKPNDVLITSRGTLGLCYIIKENDKFYFQDGMITWLSLPTNILPKYLCILFDSNFMQTLINEKSNGTAVSYISIADIKKITFPLPPLAEQKRIVAAIEKFMPLIDEYGKKETELKAFNEQIGTLTKKAILQEAVQGKLVPQIAAEGNAKDLLEEIKKEKAKLIEEKKLKKEKPLPEITEDEIPFDIPESWCWCRLGEIVQLTSGQDLQPEMYNSSQKGIPYITGASNFNNGNVIINRWTETPKSVAIKDDLLLTCKGTVGEMAFLKEKKVHIARQVMSIRSSEKISLGYVKIYLTTQIENLKSKAKSMIPGIAREDVISSLIPLSPLDEQKRIVSAIEKILPLCEKLGE